MISKNYNLKPCPFCGGEAVIDINQGTDTDIDFARCYCLACGIGTKVVRGIPADNNFHAISAGEIAAQMWNKRSDKAMSKPVCEFDIHVNFQDSDENEYQMKITEDEYERLKALGPYRQTELLCDIWNRESKKECRYEFGEGGIEDEKGLLTVDDEPSDGRAEKEVK